MSASDALAAVSALERAGRLEEAMAQLMAVVAATEVPSDGLCARAAALCAQRGDPEAAATWALRTVDGGTDFRAWRAASRVLDRADPDLAPAGSRSLKVGLLGTANVEHLVPCLRLALARAGIAAQLYTGGYGQYWQEALDPDAGLREFDPDVVILIPDHRSLTRDPTTKDAGEWVEEELPRWIDVWKALREWTAALIVQLSFVLPEDDPFGLSAAAETRSPRHRLHALDRALADAARASGVAHVDVEALAGAIGKRRWFDARYWHVAKHAFSMAVAPELALRISAVVAAHHGLGRRVLIVDLDNTLWAGVIGDDGVAGIGLTGPRGEAHVDFQQAIADLAQRGIILAACSKNDEATAALPFETLPEMVLTREHFAAFVANWEAKPDNIREIASQLSISLDACVFVDDNPAEREAVRQALPMVDVIPLSPEPAQWRVELARYPWFEPGSFTAEDGRRAESYRARAAAATLEASASSLVEFHESLDMRATIEPVNDLSLSRTAQLINKTNQFNLTGRRHSEEAVRRMVDDPDCVHLTARLEDRFTDHGLVAVALGTIDGEILDVGTFVMSCRVIGRGLETELIEELTRVAEARGCRAVRGHYQPTDRNGLVTDMWLEHGFTEVPDVAPPLRSFVAEVAERPPRSTQISLRRPR